MRKTLTTAALLLALSCPAFAGEIHTPPAPTPPPTTSAAQEPSEVGDISNPSTTDETAADSLTETVLDLLAGVLALI